MCQCAQGFRGPNCYESDGMCMNMISHALFVYAYAVSYYQT